MHAGRVVAGSVVVFAVAGAAQGVFTIGSVDFGGGFVGTNGRPLVPVGGSIVAQTTTDPGTHGLFIGAGLGTAGWGMTFGAIEDEAPSEEPPYVTNVLPVSPLAAIVPAAGTGAATASMFGGFYARGPIVISDDDAFVARIGVTSGATLQTSGMVFIAVQEVGEPAEKILGIDETGVLWPPPGPETIVEPDYKIEYRLRGNYTLGDVYDVFVRRIPVPVPGTVCALGVAGVMGAVRRRR